jgi:hypothetical protein
MFISYIEKVVAPHLIHAHIVAARFIALLQAHRASNAQ